MDSLFVIQSAQNQMESEHSQGRHLAGAKLYIIVSQSISRWHRICRFHVVVTRFVVTRFVVISFVSRLGFGANPSEGCHPHEPPRHCHVRILWVIHQNLNQAAATPSPNHFPQNRCHRSTDDLGSLSPQRNRKRCSTFQKKASLACVVDAVDFNTKRCDTS